MNGTVHMNKLTDMTMMKLEALGTWNRISLVSCQGIVCVCVCVYGESNLERVPDFGKPPYGPISSLRLDTMPVSGTLHAFVSYFWSWLPLAAFGSLKLLRASGPAF